MSIFTYAYESLLQAAPHLNNGGNPEGIYARDKLIELCREIADKHAPRRGAGKQQIFPDGDERN